jgi:hypothetical protein
MPTCGEIREEVFRLDTSSDIRLSFASICFVLFIFRFVPLSQAGSKLKEFPERFLSVKGVNTLV